MSNLDNIIDEILQDAKNESEKIVEDAKSEVANLVGETESEAQKNADKIIEKVESLDLEKYRFINATSLDYEMKCYYRGFKTKKDIV